MSTGPGDEQRPPEWQQPQWQQQDQPQFGQQDQPQWGQQQYQQAGQTPGSATASLILGICSLLICSIICGPLAIIYGNRAKRDIDASGGRLGGRGMATAGVVMGWIAVALTVIGIIVVVIVAAAGNS